MSLNQALRFHLHHKFNIDFGETPTMRMLVVGLVAEEWYYICDLISADIFNNMSDDDMDMIAKEVKAFLKMYNVIIVSNVPRYETTDKYVPMTLTVRSGHYVCEIHYTTNQKSKHEFVHRFSYIRMYTYEPDCASTGLHLTRAGFVIEKPVDKIKQSIV
jgi:hypothetical protein